MITFVHQLAVAVEDEDEQAGGAAAEIPLKSNEGVVRPTEAP